MSGVNPKFQGGPRTYEASEAIKGGQLVEHSTVASTTGLPVVRVAAANSVTCFGVAAKDAVPVTGQAAFIDAATGYPGAFPVTDISVPNETLAVYGDSRGVFIPVTYAGAVAERAPLKVAATGQVTAWVDGTDAVSRRVGYCAEPGGVAGAGVGLAWIQAQA